MITKAGVFSVVGRPNAGKSTLVNALCGAKIAIVSDKPQTTRTRITGVLNDGDCQLIFLDTPGLHKPRNRLGDFMVQVVQYTVAEVDAAIQGMRSERADFKVVERASAKGDYVKLSYEGKIGEQAGDCLGGIRLVGADDAGGAALDPA